MAKKAVFGPPTDYENGKPPPRLPRLSMPMAGWGGFVEIGKSDSLTDIDVPGGGQTERWLVEVQFWQVEPMSQWVEIPMCGGLGAMTRRLVCTDVKWRALLVWDRASAEGTNPGDVRTTERGKRYRAFPDSAFSGFKEDKFTVSLFFQLGEPAEYPNSLELGAYYYIEQATVEVARMVNQADNTKSIRAAVSGAGSSPITRWYGDQWRGGGGFEFTQSNHGFNNDGANTPSPKR